MKTLRVQKISRRIAFPMDFQDLNSGKKFKSVPIKVKKKAVELYDKLRNSRTCGDMEIVDGWAVETHTLGCRYEAGTPEEDWWDEHWEIFDDYNNDGKSLIWGDPSSGIFVTFTPPK